MGGDDNDAATCYTIMVYEAAFQVTERDFSIYFQFDSIRRYTTVQRTLTKESTVFTCEDAVEQQIFGLASTDLAQIKPNYEAMVRGGTLRITDDGYAQGKSNANLHHPMPS